MRKFNEFNVLYWVYRIGDGVKISDINRNSRRAKSVVSQLEALGLVKVEEYGRLKVVRLTAKGQRVYGKLLEALWELRLGKEREEPVEAKVSQPQRIKLEAGGLPEWLVGNPWLKVIGERGRA
ncbi:MAG: hypothetical protein DRJ96_00130 [Thermoprotei archaeon]|nr:MAG: hypothetical protein DRJ67_01900 [Thermoprotei archaeon]RLE98778.1 MAG: hypothetical protein DRJ96_00130 [Thermoprotei archaeon]